MNYLAIDTSNKNLTVVVCKDGEIFSYYDSECGVNHSVALMVEVEKLLNKSGLTIDKADFVACVVGAGSFTGIRIGVSTVKALCFAYNKPCLAITSFDTLSYNKKAGKYMAVIDAKHNGYYVAGYTDGKVTVSPQYVLKEQLLNYAKEYALLSDTDIDLPCEKVSALSGLINAVEIKKSQATFNLDEVAPLYCRKSQAEEGRL